MCQRIRNGNQCQTYNYPYSSHILAGQFVMHGQSQTDDYVLSPIKLETKSHVKKFQVMLFSRLTYKVCNFKTKEHETRVLSMCKIYSIARKAHAEKQNFQYWLFWHEFPVIRILDCPLKKKIFFDCLCRVDINRCTFFSEDIVAIANSAKWTNTENRPPNFEKCLVFSPFPFSESYAHPRKNQSTTSQSECWYCCCWQAEQLHLSFLRAQNRILETQGT